MKIAARICEAVAILLIIFTWAFSNHIDHSRPNHPMGHLVIETENHGERVYVSKTDVAIRTGGWVAFFIILLVCAALEEGLRSGDD